MAEEPKTLKEIAECLGISWKVFAEIVTRWIVSPSRLRMPNRSKSRSFLTVLLISGGRLRVPSQGGQAIVPAPEAPASAYLRGARPRQTKKVRIPFFFLLSWFPPLQSSSQCKHN